MLTPFRQAVEYIKAGDIKNGRQILIEVLKYNPRDENAWLCMSLCVTEVEQKRYCFQKVLKINPQNQHAIAGLVRLNNPLVHPVPPISSTQPQVIQQPIKREILRFSVLTLGIVLTGIALVIIFVYVFLFLPPGP